MKNRIRVPGLLAASCTAVLAAAGSIAGDSGAQPNSPTPNASYAYATNGVLDNIAGALGSKWKLLVNESNLGGHELEAVEITLPAGTVVGSHNHGSVEVIYVLSGTYDHEVNGKRYRLTPGMVGIVRPGDKVRHLVPKDTGDAKILVLWAPGGEAARVLSKAQGTKPAAVPQLP
ncbi:MAG TPA: cupin domain-containing protein [Steroidobacteraceae bacterium]|jgi:quercetin dioxygenase-like cupin family protein